MAILSKIYFDFGDGWVYQGYTGGTTWTVETLALQYAHVYYWRINTYDTATGLTTQGNAWSFTTKDNPPPVETDRSDTFDEDKYWGYNSDTGQYEWLSVETTGGGRYKRKLVVVGHNSVYYG